MTWPTVHEHLVADAFRSKKCSSVLHVHEQQAAIGCSHLSAFRHFAHSGFVLIYIRRPINISF